MRKLIAVLLICSLILTAPARNAEAWAPAIVAAGVLGSVIVVAGAMTIHKPASVPSSWPTNGGAANKTSIMRLVIPTIKVISEYNTEVIKGAAATAKVNMQQAQNALQQNAALRDKYAALRDFLLDLTSQKPQNPTPTMPQGTTIKINDGSYKTAGSPWLIDGYRDYTWNPKPNDTCNGTFAAFYIASGMYWQLWGVYVQQPDPPVWTPKQRDTLAANTVGQTQVGPDLWTIPPLVVSDIDKAIAENPSDFGVSIVDAAAPGEAENAPPVTVPPVTVPVSTAQPTVTNLNTSTVTATTQAAASSAAAADAADAAVADYAAAHPGATVENDPAFAALVTAANAARDKANVDQKAATQAQVDDKQVFPNATSEELKKLNFDSLKKLMGVMGTVFPFNLISGTTAFFSGLVRDPVAPSFDLPFPLGLTMHVDLSCLDTLAFIIRFLIGALLSVGVVYYVVRFWRGVA